MLMVAIASKQPNKQTRKTPTKKKISWETFQKKYLSREDKYKYEWVDGYVEKTNRTMDKNQSYIFDNLADFLDELKLNQSINGRFIAEVDSFFNKQHRRPDIAFYTKEQIRADKNNAVSIPQFVIEVISSTDQVNRLVKKLKDYRAADVKVIWLIFPEAQEIHVYRGLDSQIKQGNDICSADEIIKGFKMKVADVFK